MLNNKNEVSQSKNAADFEEAISACGLGFFNLFLFLTAIPSTFCLLFESTSIPYIFPVAQNALQLSLQDKGTLNAFVFFGMLCSGFLWGSIVDVAGRRKVLLIVHLVHGFCAVIGAFATSFTFMLCAKFFGGFVICGQSSAFAPYLAEFHCSKYRSRIPLILGLIFATCTMCLPFLAKFILSLEINLLLPWGVEFQAWNLFIMVVALADIMSFIAFLLLPETPKYLMSKGKNKEALKIFAKIYKINIGNSKNTYPISELESENKQTSKKFAIKTAWQQISPLFTRKYIFKVALVCLLQLFLLMCGNTLRMWLPQLFQMSSDYEYNNKNITSFCQVLSQAAIESESENGATDSSVYNNIAIVSSCSWLGYIMASLIINRIGKKKLLCIFCWASGIFLASVYFAPSMFIAIILLCGYFVFAMVPVDVTVSATIDLFQTDLRSSALSLSMTFGRIGAMGGNLIFPLLLQTGCGATFFTLGGTLIGCSFLALLLPNTDLKALE